MGFEVSIVLPKKVLILASGEGSVAQSLFDSVGEAGGALHGKIEIPLVITENPAAGIVRRAAESGIESRVIPFQSGEARARWESDLSEAVAQVNPWIVVSAGFMKILSPAFVQRFRIINTHPSLLPLFPGAHAVRDALAAGVVESGCTLHYIDEGIDTGAIIAQRALEVLPGENESSLHERIKVLERELIVTGILTLLEEGN